MFIAFYKGQGTTIFERIQDGAIRKATRSIYSHVEFVGTGEGAVLGREYVCLSASGREGSVREKRIRLDKGRWDLVPIPWCPPNAERFIRDRIGLRYDYKGILMSHVLSLNIQDPNRYLCSELLAEAIGHDRPFRMSPADLKAHVDAMNRVYHMPRNLTG